MKLPVEVMRSNVLSTMKEQEKAGNLSKAHGYDHVQNVARYASVFGKYLAQHSDLDPERILQLAEMNGWAHDVIRYASQSESGEDASAKLLETWYEPLFKGRIERDEYQRLVVDIVRNSNKSFSDMQTLYRDDPEALTVALALVAGDKLIEASGPRVLERRSFFVGNERMKNPNDLGAAFVYPFESSTGVLSETFVRLGDVNHVMNYASHPVLLKLAQELHSTQYQFYAGLLGYENENTVLDRILSRLRHKDVTKKLADRTEKGGKRLVNENHLDGNYFELNGLNILDNAIKTLPHPIDLAASSSTIVGLFSQSDSPEAAIENFRRNPEGPPAFVNWMNDIISYRNGKFADQLVERLQN